MKSSGYIPWCRRDKLTSLAQVDPSNDSVYIRLHNICTGTLKCIVYNTDMLDRVPPFLVEDKDALHRLDGVFAAHAPARDAEGQPAHSAAQTLMKVRQACSDANLRFAVFAKDPDQCVIFRPECSREAALLYLVFTGRTWVESIARQLIGEQNLGMQVVATIKLLAMGTSTLDVECLTELQLLTAMLHKPVSLADLTKRSRKQELLACMQCSKVHRKTFRSWITKVTSLLEQLLDHDVILREEQRLLATSRPFPAPPDSRVDGQHHTM